MKRNFLQVLLKMEYTVIIFYHALQDVLSKHALMKYKLKKKLIKYAIISKHRGFLLFRDILLSVRRKRTIRVLKKIFGNQNKHKKKSLKVIIILKILTLNY